MKNSPTCLLLLLVIAMAGRGMASGHMIEADMVSLESAIKLYRMTTGTLPPSDVGLAALVERPTGLPADSSWTKIMSKIPEDPWGQPYSFIRDSDLPGDYGIFSRGPNGISKTLGNDPDDFNSWSLTWRGIEANPVERMPWLLSVIVLSFMLFFYLGVRVERHWNQGRAHI